MGVSEDKIREIVRRWAEATRKLAEAGERLRDARDAIKDARAELEEVRGEASGLPRGEHRITHEGHYYLLVVQEGHYATLSPGTEG